jgi:hypothetical protein
MRLKGVNTKETSAGQCKDRVSNILTNEKTVEQYPDLRSNMQYIEDRNTISRRLMERPGQQYLED